MTTIEIKKPETQSNSFDNILLAYE